MLYYNLQHLMKISHDQVHCFVKEIYYPDAASKKCIHTISFFCWFLMIFLGTTLIGIGTSNNQVSFPFCSDSQSFCTQNILFNSSSTYYIYVKLSGFNQNNRMFMDSYSVAQLHGDIGNTDHCGSYYTYGSLGLSQTSGGYRVNSSADLHPCGEVMTTFNEDAIYVVDSSGGTPSLDSGNLISSFNKNYHFLRLNQYQISQWVDVQSQRFVNYFSVSATPTKYELVGSVAVSEGNYQIVMQNNFPTQGKFTKEVLISEVGILGVTNHLVGFTMFAYGLLLLFVHIYICFRWRK